MHRHLIAAGAALAAVAFVMPPAGASQEPGWSEPVNIGAMINTAYRGRRPRHIEGWARAVFPVQPPRRHRHQ